MRRLLLILIAAPLGARERTLTQPTARLDHQFSSIYGVRELADGRLLVADGIDNALLRVNLTTGKIDTVGRGGAGAWGVQGPRRVVPVARRCHPARRPGQRENEFVRRGPEVS